MLREEYERELPKVNELDPNDPDYIRQLELAILKVFSLGKRFKRELTEYEKSLSYISSIQGIEGVIAEEEVILDTPNETIKRQAIEISPDISKEAYREYLDRGREWTRETTRDLEEMKDVAVSLDRTKEDLLEVICGLTKIECLSEGSLDNKKLVMYILRQDGVYESYHNFNLPEEITLVKKDPNLRVKDFKSIPAISYMLKDRLKGSEVEVYVITNPIEGIPAECLVIQGLSEYVERRVEKFDKEQERLAEQDKQMYGLGPARYIQEKVRRFLGKE